MQAMILAYFQRSQYEKEAAYNNNSSKPQPKKPAGGKRRGR